MGVSGRGWRGSAAPLVSSSHSPPRTPARPPHTRTHAYAVLGQSARVRHVVAVTVGDMNTMDADAEDAHVVVVGEAVA